MKALGQVELLLSMLASSLVISEAITRRELAGITVLISSILLLVLTL